MGMLLRHHRLAELREREAKEALSAQFLAEAQEQVAAEIKEEEQLTLLASTKKKTALATKHGE